MWWIPKCSSIALQPVLNSTSIELISLRVEVMNSKIVCSWENLVLSAWCLTWTGSHWAHYKVYISITLQRVSGFWGHCLVHFHNSEILNYHWLLLLKVWGSIDSSQVMNITDSALIFTRARVILLLLKFRMWILMPPLRVALEISSHCWESAAPLADDNLCDK